jgi:predicted ribonuclease YlaK
MAKKKQKHIKSPALGSSALVLKNIKPMTKIQAEFFTNYDTCKSQVLMGSSGTGKTFLSLYKALQEVHNPDSEYNRIVIVRSAVPTRDMGFLPGNLAEKGEVYELPYRAICNELFRRGDAYEILRKHRDIEFITTSFIRGITLDRTIILVDECQSLNGHELESIITRAGKFTKILFCGDFVQTDLTKFSEKEGFKKFMQVVQNMPDDFSINKFSEQDIVRSGLVKNFLLQRMHQFPDGI